MSTLSIIPGDNRESLRRMIAEGRRVHSVVTDPPYGLVSVQKRFGKEGSAPARTENNDGSFARLSGGFMGTKWDATGIERDPEFWALIYDILLPGGYVFAFSGSRTGHWQACAMELAGFIMHPMHGWVFGQGFPKAHAADKAIDKHFGKKGEVVPTGAPVKRMIPGADQHATGSWIKDNGREYQPGEYVPATAEAAEWSGWAYGTQAQKPALEPIYLGQKPFESKTGAANLLKHGLGAVHIKGCLVPHVTVGDGSNLALNPHMREKINGGNGGHIFPTEADRRVVFPNANGRHPANLILDGSSEVVAMFPNGKSGKPGNRRKIATSHSMAGDLGLNDRVEVGYGDEGSAARFFHQFPLTDEDYETAIALGEIGTDCGNPLFYHSKAGKLDRGGSKHPTVKPIALMQYLIRHITPPGGVVLDPFAGSGTTAEAARREGFECVLMEAEPSYLEFLYQRFPEVNETLASMSFNELLL